MMPADWVSRDHGSRADPDVSIPRQTSNLHCYSGSHRSPAHVLEVNTNRKFRLDVLAPALNSRSRTKMKTKLVFLVSQFHVRFFQNKIPCHKFAGIYIYYSTKYHTFPNLGTGQLCSALHLCSKCSSCMLNKNSEQVD